MYRRLKRSSAKSTAVIPYFGYARQDRKVVPRTSISAKVVSNLITKAGANRIVDLHAVRFKVFLTCQWTICLQLHYLQDI